MSFFGCGDEAQSCRTCRSFQRLFPCLLLTPSPSTPSHMKRFRILLPSERRTVYIYSYIPYVNRNIGSGMQSRKARRSTVIETIAIRMLPSKLRLHMFANSPVIFVLYEPLISLLMSELDEWTRGESGGSVGNAADLWDDIIPSNALSSSSSTGLDLADFAAATMRFHSEHQEVAASTSSASSVPLSYGIPRHHNQSATIESVIEADEEEDVLESLMRDQRNSHVGHNGSSGGKSGGSLMEGLEDAEEDFDLNFGHLLVDEDDEILPEWNDVVIPSTSSANGLHHTATSSMTKLQPSLLFQQQPSSSSSSLPLPSSSLLSTTNMTPVAATQMNTHMYPPHPQHVPISPIQLPSSVNTAIPLLPPLARLMWEYRDPQGVVQGPFENGSMASWLEAGFFKADLPIKLSSWSSFYPLGSVFSSLAHAFKYYYDHPFLFNCKLIVL